MIIERTGNIWESGCDAIVVTVNCVGVMGKGIALEAKLRYPHIFVPYERACTRNELGIGNCMVVKTKDKPVILLPTKKHWRNPSQYSYVNVSIDVLMECADDYGFSTIAVPALGCGNGGLDWTVVKDSLIHVLKDHPSIFHIYPPNRG